MVYDKPENLSPPKDTNIWKNCEHFVGQKPPMESKKMYLRAAGFDPVQGMLNVNKMYCCTFV